MRNLSFFTCILLTIIGNAEALASDQPSGRPKRCVPQFLLDFLAKTEPENFSRAEDGRHLGFVITNRNLEEVRHYYPIGLTDFDHLKGKKVLDIGTGGGQFVYDLRKSGIDAAGVDIALKESEKRHSFFVESDAKTLPFQSESYDLIFSNMSIFADEYASRASDEFLIPCLRELARVLRNGGQAYIALPLKEERMLRLLKSIPSLSAHYGSVRSTNVEGVTLDYLVLTKR